MPAAVVASGPSHRAPPRGARTALKGAARLPRQRTTSRRGVSPRGCRDAPPHPLTPVNRGMEHRGSVCGRPPRHGGIHPHPLQPEPEPLHRHLGEHGPSRRRSIRDARTRPTATWLGRSHGPRIRTSCSLDSSCPSSRNSYNRYSNSQLGHPRRVVLQVSRRVVARRQHRRHRHRPHLRQSTCNSWSR